MELWKNFWQLANEPAYREKMGVRIAQGEGVWRPFEPGNLYTITLESNGGLNITSEPVKGIYKELLHEHADLRCSKAGSDFGRPISRSPKRGFPGLPNAVSKTLLIAISRFCGKLRRPIIRCR